jgi:hypothetical protein
MYATYMFPAFLLHGNFLLIASILILSSPIKFDESNELDRHVKEGRSVSLILSLSKGSNPSEIRFVDVCHLRLT